MGNQPTNREKSSSDNNLHPNIHFDKKELKVLYRNFVKLDKDHSGQIEPYEFFDVPDLKENPIVQRIISVFDKNNDGKISFYEFIYGLSILTNAGIFSFK
jgi:serine/threonine-protein phosphatase 2B regulatory subunit